MRILIIGHSCSPRTGSEPGGTWNWAWQLSKLHEVWVLTHPRERTAVERFLDERPNKNLRFQWQNVPRALDTWSPEKDDRGLTFHYLVWQRVAYEKAIKLCSEIGFDIAHHVSFGTVSAPPPAHRLPIPFVWGPIGGAQRVPPAFRHYISYFSSGEIIRSVRLALLPCSFSLRRAAKSSAIILTTNRETYGLLERAGARNVRLFLDSGIPSSFISSLEAPRSTNSPFTLLWVGRMQPRKALPLALEALAQTKDPSVRLLIAGDGEMRRNWERYATRLNLGDKAVFLGKIPWNEMSRLYQSADAFLFTSLRDSFGMQVLEAMAHRLPILTLNHQGAGTFVPTDAGIKIPVTTPTETVAGMAEGIRWLVRNPEARWKMGEAGLAFAKTQTWEKRAERMSKLYEEVAGARFFVRLGTPASYGSYGVRKRTEKIDETLDLRGKNVLDLGCGNGCYTAELARRAASVCGVDLQRKHLKAFRQPIFRVQAAGENLPFASESFDVVTMIEVLEHTHSDEQVLRECFRVLRSEGFLVVFAPNKLYPFESHPCHIGNLSIGPNIPLVSWFPESLRKRLCHARIYTWRRLHSLAKGAGFQTHKSERIFPPLDSFPLPFKEFYRRAARKLEQTPLASLGVSIYAVFQKPGSMWERTQMASRLDRQQAVMNCGLETAKPFRCDTYKNPGEGGSHG